MNLDGTVNIFDINLVSAHWGEAGPAGDANGDGVVNIFDINLISAALDGRRRRGGRARTGRTDPGGLRARGAGELARLLLEARHEGSGTE